jgi:hypothetical protein
MSEVETIRAIAEIAATAHAMTAATARTTASETGTEQTIAIECTNHRVPAHAPTTQV